MSNPVTERIQENLDVEAVRYAINLDEIVITPGEETEEPMNWLALLSIIYIVGLVTTIIIKVGQLVLLYRAVRRGVLWKEKMEGVTVYCHVGDVAPFSCFRTVVINEKDYNESAKEILCHELGHIHCQHSLDVMLLNICECVQWCNPLSWILASSLADIHEYEADDAVLASGVEAHKYQMLLIKKAVGSSSYAFANNFNHSLLKKRIAMMINKKSNPWMRTKSLYIIPVAAIALSAFATPELNTSVEAVVNNLDKESVTSNPIEVIENVIKESRAEEVVSTAEVAEKGSIKAGDVISGVVSDEDGPLGGATVLEYNSSGRIVSSAVSDTNGKYELKVVDPNDVIRVLSTGHVASISNIKSKKIDVKMEIGALDEVEIVSKTDNTSDFSNEVVVKSDAVTSDDDKKQKTVSQTTSEDDEEWVMIEETPEFPGGNDALKEWLKNNIKYPERCVKEKIQGRVYASFFIEKDGSISNVKLMRVPNNAKEMGEEATRVILAMPKWKPGKQRGKEVRVKYVLPVVFNLASLAQGSRK